MLLIQRLNCGCGPLKYEEISELSLSQLSETSIVSSRIFAACRFAPIQLINYLFSSLFFRICNKLYAGITLAQCVF